MQDCSFLVFLGKRRYAKLVIDDGDRCHVDVLVVVTGVCPHYVYLALACYQREVVPYQLPLHSRVVVRVR